MQAVCQGNRAQEQQSEAQALLEWAKDSHLLTRLLKCFADSAASAGAFLLHLPWHVCRSVDRSHACYEHAAYMPIDLAQTQQHCMPAAKDLSCGPESRMSWLFLVTMQRLRTCSLLHSMQLPALSVADSKGVRTLPSHSPWHYVCHIAQYRLSGRQKLLLPRRYFSRR